MQKRDVKNKVKQKKKAKKRITKLFYSISITVDMVSTMGCDLLNLKEEIDMKTKIISRATDQNVMSFYITSKDKQYYLFSQTFYRSVQEYYGRGILLTQALDTSSAHRNRALLHTMCKLPAYIKYIEKEHDLTILDQTIRKQQASRKRAHASLKEAC